MDWALLLCDRAPYQQLALVRVGPSHAQTSKWNDSLPCMPLFRTRAHRSTKVWPHRSRRLMRMAFAELTVALLNSIFFLIPNA